MLFRHVLENKTVELYQRSKNSIKYHSDKSETHSSYGPTIYRT